MSKNRWTPAHEPSATIVWHHHRGAFIGGCFASVMVHVHDAWSRWNRDGKTKNLRQSIDIWTRKLLEDARFYGTWDWITIGELADRELSLIEGCQESDTIRYPGPRAGFTSDGTPWLDLWPAPVVDDSDAEALIPIKALLRAFAEKGRLTLAQVDAIDGHRRGTAEVGS